MRQIHRKAEGDGAGIPVDPMLPTWSKSSSNAIQVGKFAQVATHCLGVASVGGVLYWCGGYRGGLMWNGENKDLLFNFHPVLMITGFIFLHTEANLLFKTSTGSKNYRKLLHLLVQGLALLLGLVGVYAALKFHNEKSIDNFYSLHSWLGLLTITAFSIQWLVGFVTFWYPGGSPPSRAAVLPWHVFAGLVIFSLTLLTAETGLLEKLTFLQTGKVVQRYGNEALLVNSLGIILVLLGISVFIALVTPRGNNAR